jgi:creatinine amidohydrolase
MTHPRDPHLLSDLAVDDIQAYLERRRTILIPIASTEQHGPHLPLSTDTITAEEVSRRAAAAADVLYTPTVWTGYSPQHLREPQSGTGTISVRASTFTELLIDIARSLIHHGFTHLIFVNGHGSNMKIIDPVLRRLRYETGVFVACYKPYAERYMGLVDDVLENPREETPGWHASELETSQVMAYDETLVIRDRMAETVVTAPEWLPDSFKKADGAPDIEFEGYQYFVMPMDHQEFTETGVIGNPMRATKEKGEEAFRRFADHLVKAIPEFEKVEVEIREPSLDWIERV